MKTNNVTITLLIAKWLDDERIKTCKLFNDIIEISFSYYVFRILNNTKWMASFLFLKCFCIKC